MDMPPIKECQREGCGKMFFVVRSDKRFCSNNCASGQWYKDVTAGKRRPARATDAETTTTE